MKARVAAYHHRDKERFLAGTERVRTYNEATNRVIDYASGLEMRYKDVMKDPTDMIIARAMAKKKD